MRLLILLVLLLVGCENAGSPYFITEGWIELNEGFKLVDEFDEGEAHIKRYERPVDGKVEVRFIKRLGVNSYLVGQQEGEKWLRVRSPRM